MQYSAAATAISVLLLLATPALAFGLTQSDYDYLATQDFGRDSSILKGLSPKEQARLHAIIVDQTTTGDVAARAKNVAGAMAAFEDHQHWEETHPGQLWDSTKR